MPVAVAIKSWCCQRVVREEVNAAPSYHDKWTTSSPPSKYLDDNHSTTVLFSADHHIVYDFLLPDDLPRLTGDHLTTRCIDQTTASCASNSGTELSCHALPEGGKHRRSHKCRLSLTLMRPPRLESRTASRAVLQSRFYHKRASPTQSILRRPSDDTLPDSVPPASVFEILHRCHRG